MAVPQSHSPDAAYLTKPNIVHPESNYTTAQHGAALVAEGERRVAASETQGRQHQADRTGLTISGGAIKRGK